MQTGKGSSLFRVHRLVAFLCAALVAGCGGAEQEAAPVVERGPAHEAPFAVGSRTFFIHDGSRHYDVPGGVDFGVRTMITEIWYPAEHASIDGFPGKHRRATYGDYVFGNRDVHQLMMTGTTFFHMTPDSVREGVDQDQIAAAIDELFGRQRASYVEAPLAATDSSLPVVVMSHGDAGSRYNMESVCEYLAAHGYFVIAAEHTGNSPFSMTGKDPALASDDNFRDEMEDVIALLGKHGTYGNEDNYGQSYTPLSSGRGSLEFLQALDASLLQRLNDLRAVLAELDDMNSSGFFAGRLELERIGLMGRSFGGGTTLMGLAMEPRFTSGFAVVPPGWVDPRAALPPEVLVETESVLFAASGPFPLTHFSKPTVLLNGAEDGLIIGLGASMAEQAGLGAPTVDNPHPILRAAYEASDAPLVWGVLRDSNHATFGVSGGYWWPDLKPNTQDRFFDPGEKFELADVTIAHDMQRKKALAFFDLTIRLDESAKQRLMDQSFSDDGLILESRNF